MNGKRGKSTDKELPLLRRMLHKMLRQQADDARVRDKQLKNQVKTQKMKSEQEARKAGNPFFDPFGVRAEANADEGHANDNDNEDNNNNSRAHENILNATYSDSNIAVFLLNYDRNRFSGFIATRYAELSPLRVRQFIHENGHGLVSSFPVE